MNASANLSIKTLFALCMACFFLSSAVGGTVRSQHITLVSAEFEPYIGTDLPNNGYVYHLIKEAFSRSGYTVDIQFYPMARARYIAEKGNVDGIAPFFSNVNLQDKFAFSIPFPGSDIGLLKKKNLHTDLLGKTIDLSAHNLNIFDKYVFGAVRGAENFRHIDPSNTLNKDLVKTDLQNIDKLSRGRIDFAFIDKYVAADLMVLKRPNLIGTLDFIPITQAQKTFYLALSKKTENYQQKLEAFNQGLSSIMQDGTLERIRSEHGLNQIKPNNKQVVTLTIGMVNNPEMLMMQELSHHFEKEHPNIKLEWKLLTENTLRRRLMSDLAISEGQFDIVMIGPYETPIWAKNKWLMPISNLPKSYDIDDIFTPIRKALSYQDTLYALPFYGESSITFYRKDLFQKAGIKMPLHPSYDELMTFAQAIHDPKNNVYGIGLRGKAGWGQNMSYLSTLVNTFGGRWFNENWKPMIDSKPWHTAINYYNNILKKYGHPNKATNGWQENRDLFASGQLGMMIDASVLSAKISDPKLSSVHDKVGFAFAPTAVTQKGAQWLWSWALAIPSSSKHAEEATEFLLWATSKKYITSVIKDKGWLAVPPGTRYSTYQKEYLKHVPFADITLKAINHSDPNDFTLKPVPYTGIGFVNIPEYPAIGRQVGLEINKVLQDKITVEQALKNAQELTTRQMQMSNYIE